MTPFSSDRSKIDAALCAAKEFAINDVLNLPPEECGNECKWFDYYFSGDVAELEDGHVFTRDCFHCGALQDILLSSAQSFLFSAGKLLWPDDGVMPARVMTELRTGKPVECPTHRAVTFLLARVGFAVVEHAAWLHIVLSGGDARSDDDVFAAFQQAITRWINTTDEGRAAWYNSGEDFNIGDLMHEGGDLAPFMAEVGICSYLVDFISVTTNRQYDTVLVDRSLLNLPDED